MSWLSRFLNVFRRDRLHRDFEDEMQFHLSSRIDELVRRGMPAEEAKEQAGRQFGNSLVLLESSRDIKLFPRIESIFRDVVFGVRQCLRNKTVTTVAVLLAFPRDRLLDSRVRADRCADPAASYR